jgi:transcriptional regulator with XRE-family HTH domain
MSAVQSERDYGQEAMMRRLGLLAKQRREELGLGRVEFAKLAGLGSDSTVQQFEFGQRWPRPQTLRKLEVALGWRNQVIDELTESTWLKASEITLADLDKPAEQPAPRPLSAFSTAELMREVASRMEALQAGLGAPDMREHFDLAASDDHVEGEDDRD